MPSLILIYWLLIGYLIVFNMNCLFCHVLFNFGGPGGSMSQVVGLPSNSYKPITDTTWVRAWLCIRLTAASDKVYQLLAHGRWFSPSTPASSTTKTGRHEIVEILLKVALNTINQIKSNQIFFNLVIACIVCFSIQGFRLQSIWSVCSF